MTTASYHSHAFPSYRTRRTEQASQPRYVVSKRLNSVRLNWFMFGSVFGIILSFLFNVMVGGMLSLPNRDTVRVAETANVITPHLTVSEAAVKIGHSAPSEGPITKSHISDDLLTRAVNREDDTFQSAAPAEMGPTYPKTITHQLKSGETLANILVDQSIDYSHAHAAIEALKKEYKPRNLRAGQEITLTLDKTGEQTVLDTMSIETSVTEEVVLERDALGQFVASKIQKALSPQLTLAGGTINNSLFETGYANGIPDGVLAELMQAYSFDVDFQREIQRGDQIEVLFERMVTEEGESAGYGNIHYATLKLRGKPLSIYRYQDKDGHAGFFDENGESIRKALLKTPVSGARISSGFGKRRHPILGYTKMHQGTDFAAPTGTPIYAAGDGVVTFKGRKGGYGNYIKIKHNSTYSTAYAHMHRYGKGMRKGRKVKQGQIIGYVGSTGRSTGPHLHYEVHKNGRQVNPMKEKFKTGKILKGTELANFKRSISKIKQQVASMPRQKTTIARVD